MTAHPLPLFPLPLVLYPGATVPLHIFEPRYRQMLADCLAGDRRFGLLAVTDEQAAVQPGAVGCVARIGEVERLPDGRSNIVVTGEDRFAVVAIADAGTPYLMASVEAVYDRDEPAEELSARADAVRTLFDRVSRAARALADDHTPRVPLPEDPALLAFAIAARLDVDIGERLAVLASRSALERLELVATTLVAAVGALEWRAAMHQRARSNGRGSGAAH